MYDIAMICDRNYYIPTLVTIRSLKENRCKSYQYNVYIVIDFEDTQIEEKFANEQDTNFTVQTIKVKNVYEELDVKHAYVSKSALLKFMLPNIFNDHDKILYMDGDILIRKGFEDIFNYSIDDVYAAVVEDMNIAKMDHPQKLGLKRYFNSGVMYLNLKKLRENNMTNSLLEYKKNEQYHLFMDQDCFNVCFKDQVVFMHPKYNFIYELVNIFSDEQIAEHYEIDKFERQIELDKIPVMHLAGAIKPWKEKENPFFVEWFSHIHDFGEYAVCEKNYNQAIVDLKNKYSSFYEKINMLEETSNQEKEEIAELNQSYKKIDNTVSELKAIDIESKYQQLKQAYEKLERDYIVQQSQIMGMMHTLEQIRNFWPVKIFRKIKRGKRHD